MNPIFDLVVIGMIVGMVLLNLYFSRTVSASKNASASKEPGKTWIPFPLMSETPLSSRVSIR